MVEKLNAASLLRAQRGRHLIEEEEKNQKNSDEEPRDTMQRVSDTKETKTEKELMITAVESSGSFRLSCLLQVYRHLGRGEKKDRRYLSDWVVDPSAPSRLSRVFLLLLQTFPQRLPVDVETHACIQTVHTCILAYTDMHMFSCLLSATASPGKDR